MKCVCVGVYRTNDRACLQRLVFNMQDSDVLRFDERICHNSSLDRRTRRALYSNIRRQVARNFELANNNQMNPICRYCRMDTGQLNEYVAFVVFSEAADFQVSTSASQDVMLPAPGAADATGTAAGRNVDVGEFGTSEFRGVVEESANGSHSEITAGNWEVIGEVKEREPAKKPEMKHSLGADKKQEVENNVEVGRREDVTHEVVDAIKTGSMKTSTTLVDQFEDIETDEPDVMTQLDESEGIPKDLNDQPSELDVPEQSVDEIATVSSPPHERTVAMEARSLPGDSLDMDVSVELYVWNSSVVLQTNTDNSSDEADPKNTEYEKLSDWLSSRIDSTTAIHRFPTLHDLPVLGPRENPEMSVTWRLAEKFMPSTAERNAGMKNGAGDKYVASTEAEELKAGKAASDVIFIGPYDSIVIRHSEVVRRRVNQTCDDVLPRSSSEVICVVDVGTDVGLTSVGDIVDTSRLSAEQYDIYTATNASRTQVSCAVVKLIP